MVANKGTAIAIVGYATAALIAGALAAGGQRDGASASTNDQRDRQPPATVTDGTRFPSLDSLLYSNEDFSVARSFFGISGLTARLDNGRRHTVFLPVDRAFADQQGVSDALSRPTNSRELRRLLAFHVARGSRGLLAGANLRTLASSRLPIRSDGRRWWAQDAEIVGGPLRFPGGNVYLVDAILVAPGERPPLSTATTVMSATTP